MLEFCKNTCKERNILLKDTNKNLPAFSKYLSNLDKIQDKRSPQKFNTWLWLSWKSAQQKSPFTYGHKSNDTHFFPGGKNSAQGIST